MKFTTLLVMPTPTSIPQMDPQKMKMHTIIIEKVRNNLIAGIVLI